MNKNTKLKALISTAAVSLGLALSATAQTTVPTPASNSSSWGLLGTGYTSVNFRYTDLDGGSPSAVRGAGVEFNQAVRDGLDFKLGYDWERATAGSYRYTGQDLTLGGALYTKLDWGKPFVQANAGWEWARGGGVADDSFIYLVGAGVEFQVAPPIVVTPYINFVRATGFNRSEFDYGVKATYRITRQWGVSAGVQYQDVSHTKNSTQYLLGVNYHY